MQNEKENLTGLNVFSRKLGKPIELCVCNGRISTKENSINYLAWSNAGWSNSSDDWINNGWSNSSDSWVNDGWSNSYGNWINDGWSNSSDSWTNGGWNNSGGGCYITTACVEYMGLSDDCYELNILRHYRDVLVENDEDFRKSVLEYYRKAPVIVQKIVASENKDKILSYLYNELVKKSVNLLTNNKVEEAKKHYLNIFYQLIDEFC